MKQIEPNPWSVIEQKYPVGTKVSGAVRNVTNFGVFIGLEEGIDGLVHVSDISWTEQIKHPSEKFNKGDVVEAVVLKIDKENEKFSLGIKQLQGTWRELLGKYRSAASEVTGPITNVATSAAFVKLEGGHRGVIYQQRARRGARRQPGRGGPARADGHALVTRVVRTSRRSRCRSARSPIASSANRSETGGSAVGRQATTLGDLLAERLARKAEADSGVGESGS